MPWIAALGGLAIAGAGQLAASSDRQKQLDANKAAVQKWLDLNIPDPEQQKVVLKKFIQTGQLDPQIEQAVQRDASAYEQIKQDPNLKASQLRALGSLEQIGNEGGMTLQDKANLQGNLNDISTQERGKRLAIEDNFARRGLGNSGLSLVAQLQNSQGANQQAANASLQTAASSRQRALDSIIQGGRLAGDIGQQQYNQQSDLARARDQVNQFNAQNLQSVQQRNVNRANDAQQYNLGIQQNVANQNTELANKQNLYNTGLQQTQYENQLKRAAGASNQYGGVANTYGQQAQSTANLFGGVGSGVIKAGTAYGQNYGGVQNQTTGSNAPAPQKRNPEDDPDYWGGAY